MVRGTRAGPYTLGLGPRHNQREGVRAGGGSGRYPVWLSVGREGERYIGGLRTYKSGWVGGAGGTGTVAMDRSSYIPR